MVGILILYVVMFGPSTWDAAQPIQEISDPLHRFCIDRIEQAPTIYTQLYGALACGQKDINSQWLNLFRQSGLYHLLVVSGAHLVFLLQLVRPWWGRWHLGSTIIFSFLCFFSLMAKAEAPVIRSLLSILLGLVASHAGWRWKTVHLHIYSSLIVLIIFPSWIISLSFWLSWLAAISISISGQLCRRPLTQNLVAFIIMLPGLAPLGTSHPTQVLFNTLLGSLVGFGMLPVSFLILLWPKFSPLTDPIWSGVIWLLQHFAEGLPVAVPKFSLESILIYTISLQLTYYFGNIWWRRFKIS